MVERTKYYYKRKEEYSKLPTRRLAEIYLQEYIDVQDRNCEDESISEQDLQIIEFLLAEPKRREEFAKYRSVYYACKSIYFRLQFACSCIEGALGNVREWAYFENDCEEVGQRIAEYSTAYNLTEEQKKFMEEGALIAERVLGPIGAHTYHNNFVWRLRDYIAEFKATKKALLCFAKEANADEFIPQGMRIDIEEAEKNAKNAISEHKKEILGNDTKDETNVFPKSFSYAKIGAAKSFFAILLNLEREFRILQNEQ